MRVLHVTDNYPSKARPISGTFVRAQVQALAGVGAEVTVAHLTPLVPPGLGALTSKWRQYQAITPGSYQDGPVRVVVIPYLAYPRSLYWGYPDRLMAWALRRYGWQSWKPDIVHGHFIFPAGSATRMIGKTWDIPCVLTAHGSDVNYYPHFNSGALRRFTHTVAGADQVIAVSQALASRIRQLAPCQPLTMPIGVNVRRFRRTPPNDAKRRLGLRPDRSYLIYAGGLLIGKGLRELMAAFGSIAPRFPHVDLLVVGDGKHRAEVVAAAQSFAHRVQFVGAVPHDDIATWMSACELLVLPSYSEGLPTVIVEAGALGIPVVATDVGGIPELIVPGETGWLVPPRDVGTLTEALCEALCDPGRSERIGKNLCIAVHRNYDVEQNGRALYSLYSDLINRTGRSGFRR